MEKNSFDVVVVGAGTSGAAVAYQFAVRGKRVALVERGDFAQAGARWVNGVAPWMFDRAGITRPQNEELRGRDGAFLLHSKDGGHHVRVDSSPVWQVDMRLLVARLQALGKEAGVVGFQRCRVRDAIIDAGRLTEVVLSTNEGATLRLAARLFVDATGMAGAIRRRVPALAGNCMAPHDEDVCSAAQEVRRLRNRAAARRWLEGHGAKPGDAVSYVGVDGGFSTLVVQIDLQRGEVELLSGSTADGTHQSGPKLIADFVAREPWIGRKVFGGSGAIPLRRPFEAIAVPGVALVGDSACQVFPAHGSGVGTGLIAGRILAESCAGAADPGARGALWAYQRAFMREVGAVSAAYDVVRQLSQGFTDREAIMLIASGLTTPAMASATLAQQMCRPSRHELLGLVRAVRAAPKLAAKLAPQIAKMQAVYYLYRLYPATADGPWAEAWRKLNAWLLGEKSPDMPEVPVEVGHLKKAA